MMRIFFACCLAVAGGLPARAQQLNSRLYQDSLRTAIAAAPTDSARAVAAFQLAEHLATRDTLQAAYLISEGLQWAKGSPLAKALHPYYSALLISQTDRDAAARLYLQADSLLSPFADSLALAVRSKAWHRYGGLRLFQDDPKQFTDILLNKAIPLARRTGDSSLIGKHYLGIGYVFRNQGQHDVADEYMRTALRVLREGHSPPDQLLVTYIALAENSSLWERNGQAPEMLDSARVLLAPYPDSYHWIDYYAAESLYFNTAKNWTAALESLGKGIAIAGKLQKRYEQQRLELQQYYALHNLGRYREALAVITYLANQPEMMAVVTNRLLVYAGLAETHAAMGNGATAYQWQKKYSAVSDSFHTSHLRNEISAMEVRYRNAEHQEKIATLEAKARQAQLASHNTRLSFWLLAVGSVLVLASAVFIYFQYRNGRRLASQKLKDMEQRQMIATSHAMLEGEERERRRVARDLHDGLGGMLAGMKIRLSGMAAGEESGPLDQVIGQLDHSVNELRRIARNMMPENLFKFGLETALRDLCESLSTPVTRISYQAFGIAADIPVQTQVTIYRIVQEALANAIRHAHAKEVILQCSQNGDTFFITIEDDGKGFDVPAKEESTGTGLTNIRNRVHYLKGKLDIHSVIGEGTAINIEIHVEADN
ncbi:sensor histidine kinase [Chitinophaga caseinilytica]|uniref:Sensor histidine kinase n=1 Tax=Chitinophaga caseinilytica TaxID=2267521 RepID=A0ABZ2Z2E5_9BACT